MAKSYVKDVQNATEWKYNSFSVNNQLNKLYINLYLEKKNVLHINVRDQHCWTLKNNN